MDLRRIVSNLCFVLIYSFYCGAVFRNLQYDEKGWVCFTCPFYSRTQDIHTNSSLVILLLHPVKRRLIFAINRDVFLTALCGSTTHFWTTRIAKSREVSYAPMHLTYFNSRFCFLVFFRTRSIAAFPRKCLWQELPCHMKSTKSWDYYCWLYYSLCKYVNGIKLCIQKRGRSLVHWIVQWNKVKCLVYEMKHNIQILITQI